MSQAFTLQLGLNIWKINVENQKINNTILKTYEIVIFTFCILDKDNRVRFLKKSFYLVDIKSDIVIEMLFLTMSNIDINFQAQNLQ